MCLIILKLTYAISTYRRTWVVGTRNLTKRQLAVLDRFHAPEEDVYPVIATETGLDAQQVMGTRVLMHLEDTLR